MNAAVGSFVAIDFETANENPDSACALALVRVENRRIVRKEVCLIRPGSARFIFSDIHGISWADVQDERPFAEVWEDVQAILDGAQHFLVAGKRGMATSTAGVSKESGSR
jgi:DNA polymerase-3 subunit epsilon